MGRGQPKKFRAFGEEKTIREWLADHRCKVSHSAVCRRVGRGWSLAQALSAAPHDEDRIEAFGDRKTVGEWAKDPRCAVRERTLAGRLARGEPIEEALMRPANKPFGPRARNGKGWTAFGQTLTANQWAADPRCVVSLHVLGTRLRAGTDPELAITKPLADHERRFTAFRETKSLTAWSKDERCAVCYGTLTQRIDRGWDIVDALTVAPLGKGNPVTERGSTASKPSNGKLPNGRDVALEAFGESKTLRQWAEDPRCQVPYLRLRTRLIHGWTLEDAIKTVPAVGNRNVEAFGESKSLYAWEKDPRCLVTQKTLRHRMMNGESLEEAMSRPSQNERLREFWQVDLESQLCRPDLATNRSNEARPTKALQEP
jgi:hypothetical protein